MNERVALKEFAVETEIFSVDLPGGIIKRLADEEFVPDPEAYYDVDIVFDKRVYGKAEFYRYPIPEKKMPKETTKRQSKQERAKDIICAVLSSQLEAARKAMEEFGLLVGSAAIIGDEHGDGVTVILYEGKKPEPVKGRKVQTHFHVDSVMPDRPYILEQAAKALADIVRMQIQEEGIKEQRRQQHTPNWIPADAVFAAVSKACCPENTTEAEDLKTKLMEDALIESDWPLHICSRSGKNQVGIIAGKTLLDCSEYMVFQQYQGSRWELKTVNDLKDARRIIAKEGFNKKQTEAIIVLHNLEPVTYTLFAESEEGLHPVSTEEARGNKKLLVSWN